MAKTYSRLRAVAVKKKPEDDIIILFNENKISETDVKSKIRTGNLAISDNVLCVSKEVAEMLAD
jgi:hypothetical protein